MDERKNAVSPRKYVPFIIGALLFAALMLIQFSSHTNPARVDKPDGKTTVQSAPGEHVIDQISDIHVSVSLPADQFRQLVGLNRNFMMKYPHIQVQLANEEAEDRAYGLWTEQSQQGTASDIMLLDNGLVIPFAVEGFLKPADSIMTGDMLSDQMTGLLDPLRWNGYLWGVPKDVNPYVVVWNGDLLTKAGLKEPPTDWAAYQTAAAKVMEWNAETSIVNWSAGDLYQQLVWLGTFQTDQSDHINLRKITEKQADQLKWLQAVERNVSRISMEATGELNEALLGNKLLAAILPWDVYEKLSEKVRGKLVFDRNHILFPWLNGRSYVISSKSKVEEEAMLWIREMTDINNQQQTYEQSKQLPARASLYAFNSSIQSGQLRIPPAWWLKRLNAKQPDDQLAFPEPQWPVRWQKRERLWQLFSQQPLQIDAYINALTASE